MRFFKTDANKDPSRYQKREQSNCGAFLHYTLPIPIKILPANPAWEVNSHMQANKHNAYPQREFFCNLHNTL